MASLRLKAYAKINLHLHVGRKRKDGYHSLDTLFQEISLHDKLSFTSSANKRISITVTGRPVSSHSDNLVVCALEMLRSRLKISSGMKVRLEKQIPMGAGLGGGSSDAAAALWAGWILWNRKPHASLRKTIPPMLHDCAKKLGADVPFFLKGGRARGRGIGDKLKFLSEARSQWLVLVYPRVHVSTPLAYKMFDQQKNVRVPSSKYFNSFEPVVFKKFPEVGRVAALLRALGCRPVLMSGSGSSVFGMVKNKKAATKIKRILSKKKWDVFVVHTVGA